MQKSSKGVLILTGNMESAITLADQVYRLDENGLYAIEVKAEEIGKEADPFNERQLPEQEVNQPIKFGKIPTKVNEKMVLFDPLEIDYIESLAGKGLGHIYSSWDLQGYMRGIRMRGEGSQMKGMKKTLGVLACICCTSLLWLTTCGVKGG